MNADFAVSEIISIFIQGLSHNLDKHMLDKQHVYHDNQLFNPMDDGLNHRPILVKLMLYCICGLLWFRGM